MIFIIVQLLSVIIDHLMFVHPSTYLLDRWYKGSPKLQRVLQMVSNGPGPVFANRYSSFNTFINESRNHVLIDIENIEHIP